MSFLFVDRIIDFAPGKTCQGIKHITNDDEYLFYSKDNELCFSPCMIGETLGQLAAWNVMFSFDFKKRPVAGVVECARLNRNVFKGETLLLKANIDSLDDEAVQYSAQAYVGDEEVFNISRAIGPMLPMQDFIAEDLVKAQFNEIYRPGEWSDYTASLSDFHLKSSNATIYTVPMSYDRVIEHEHGVRMIAAKKITRQSPYFRDHFPNKPVLPMTVLLESKINLAYEFASKTELFKNYKLKDLQKIKMNDFVHPGDEIVTSLIVIKQEKDELRLRFRTEVAKKRVCVMEMVMIPSENA